MLHCGQCNITSLGSEEMLLHSPIARTTVLYRLLYATMTELLLKTFLSWANVNEPVCFKTTSPVSYDHYGLTLLVIMRIEYRPPVNISTFCTPSNTNAY